MRTELPAWMTPVLARLGFSCAENGFVQARVSAMRDHVEAVADSVQNGRAELRAAALRQLTDERPEMVDRAVSCLFVLGTADDLGAIRPLIDHGDVRVQKAARTCVFELERRGGA